ncbi:MAG: restriction endonuclease, partial [Arenimonas sp.]
TAYHLGEANIRDFANGVQLIGASRGILVTLGTIEDMAKDTADKYDIELIDGKALWPRIEGYLSSSTLTTVRQQASSQTTHKVQLGAVLSLVLGVIGFFVMDNMKPVDTVDTTVVAANQSKQVSATGTAAAATAVTNDAASNSVDPTLAQINATAKAMDEIDKLTDQERAKRKAKAAATIAEMPVVNTAIWYSASTLQLHLNTEKNDDKVMLGEICRILTQYEELRFTRVQLEPPAGSTVPVRFRQCQ